MNLIPDPATYAKATLMALFNSHEYEERLGPVVWMVWSSGMQDPPTPMNTYWYNYRFFPESELCFLFFSVFLGTRTVPGPW